MADLILTLGTFAFAATEIPEKITFGGDQKLAVHELVGGRRVIDAMGRSDMPIGWSGLFLGQEALNRARYLDGLRVSGKKLPLKWHEMSYDVIVQHFAADFERWYQVPYQISLMVVEDKTTRITGFLQEDSVTDLVNADMMQAQTIGAEVNNSVMTEKLNAIQEAIRTVSDFGKATQDQINSVLQPIADANAQVQILIEQTAAVIEDVTTLGGVLPNNPIAKSANKLLDQVAAMTSSPKLYDLQRVLGRMKTNIGTIGTGKKAVNVAGGNLFSIASDQYGDATEWTVLAKANKLVDPVIAGIKSIKVPNNTTESGGILKA